MRKSSSLYSIDAFVERKITSEKYQDVVTVADSIADVITVSDNIADVNTVAPNILDVVIVADNIISVVTAATNIADILTVAANDANVTTVAGLDAEITALAGIITALQSLYTDKATLDSLYADKATLDSLYADKATLDSLFADKATLDSLFADKVTLDSLYADKTTLDTIYADLSNIDIVATNIADVNTVTSNIVAIGDVATDIANVNTVATNITDVNTIADNMTDVTYFADVYQGPKAVEPTLRNDSSALQSGDLYFDTVFNKMMVYGIEWTPAASAVNGADNSEHFVATAGQTLFTLSSGYDVGYLYVFQNGVLLDSADFTATDGSTFTLTTGATVDDNIFALAMGAFALADHYTKAELDGGQLDTQYLAKDNTDAYTPTADYEPATKKYTDDAIAANPSLTVLQRNTVQLSSAGALVENGTAVDVPSGSVVSFAAGKNGTNGDVDKLATTDAHAGVTLTASSTNYIYFDYLTATTVTVGATTTNVAEGFWDKYTETQSQFKTRIGQTADYYDANEGVMYNSSDVAIERVYVGECEADGSGLLVASSLVNYGENKARFGDVVIFNGLDLGQSMIDVLSSRSVDTPVLNDTGSTIFVAVTFEAATSAGALQYRIEIDSTITAQITLDGSDTYIERASYVFPVPNGSSYAITNVTGSDLYWYEFKQG